MPSTFPRGLGPGHGIERFDLVKKCMIECCSCNLTGRLPVQCTLIHLDNVPTFYNSNTITSAMYTSQEYQDKLNSIHDL